MRQFNKFLCALLIIAVTVFGGVFAGCGNGETENLTGNATVVIAGAETTTYTVDLAETKLTTANRAWDLIIYLSDTQNLEFAASSSAYGKYFTKVGELQEDKKQSRYISIYTNVEKDFSTFEPVATVEYNDKTLKVSGTGISGMHVEKDCVIYFTIITY